jgi:ribosomal protein S18 acetylase RimI-like enzyme
MTLVGARFIKGFYKFYIRQSAIVFVAVSSGRVVGLVCGGEPGLRQKFSRRYGVLYAPDIMLSVIRSDYARGRLLHHVGQPIKKLLRVFLSRTRSSRCSVNDMQCRWSSLLSVCTAPEFRSMGIGVALMKRFEKESRARGYKAMRLSAHKDNTAAIKFYRKCSCEVVLESDAGVYFKKNLS